MPTPYYPRLYRLSTLNLIYHGSFDYQLNPWCTSFAGESGVGKSMIADLLQLIFVGAGEYKSATHAKGNRPPEGLVLDDAVAGGKGLGYAFLTVEVQESRFVVIGCYLAAAARVVTPFIVQQGISFAGQLEPLKRPLGYQDFLSAGGLVLPRADAEAHMRSNERVTLRFFDRLSDYHRILYDNEILPLDVNQPGVLRNYAKIIRSFSRSGDLDQHKTKDDLKNFLFGEEAKKAIWDNYQKRIGEISQQLADHQRNTSLIADITDKLTRFRGLHERRQAARKAEEALLLARVIYQQGEELRAAAALATAARATVTGQTKLLQLERAASQQQLESVRKELTDYLRLVEEQKKLSDKQQKWKQTESAAQQKQQELRPAADKARQYREAVAQVTSWLRTHGNLAELRVAQRRHQQTRWDYELVRRLDEQLAADKLTTTFENTNWTTARAAEHAIATLREQVAEGLRGHVFTDLTNPDSLARWAFERKRALTLEEESILTHFGRFAELRRVESEAAHYLHGPDELFAHPLQLIEGEKSGFWLHLQGVRVWVPRLALVNCAFTDADAYRITRLFAKRQEAAQHNLKALQARLQQEEAVYAALQKVAGWQQAVELVSQRVALSQAVGAGLLPDSSVFDGQLELYAADADVRATHEEAEAAAQKANEACMEAQIQQGIISSKLNDIAVRLSGKDERALTEKDTAAQQANASTEQKLAGWMREHTIGAEQLPLGELKLASLRADIAELSAAVGTQRTLVEGLRKDEDAARLLRDTQLSASQAATATYEKATGQAAPAPPASAPAASEEPDEKEYKDAVAAYRKEFDTIMGRYLTDADRERLSYDDALSLLIQEVLPDVVHGFVESEEALGLIEARLQNINEANNQIAGLKIQLLRGVFERVREAFDEYIEEAKKIKRYFLAKNAQITGGFSPKLDLVLSDEYPIGWIGVFGQLLSERAAGNSSLFAQLSSLESMQELMRKAYLSSGGKVQNARDTDLLNPKSYLDLSFDMKSASGRINHGSTGQTFMAAALLNIARLSVIGGGSKRPGIRLIPVDEAHGLGSNYKALLALAHEEKYQVISLSVGPMIETASAEHRLYFLAFDPDPNTLLNLHPMMLNLQQKLVPAALPMLPSDNLFANGD
ncbi:hypothetical protein HHL22_13180 [Hymenobacter sp. RP-2-7]|uniref:Uncharacterized protein n=1 Tax=Hymenobacter polaris TaxID=2682546 RepID=A0A7Y0AF36_9BACT|nr:hypothetical protein [Hymenobacter polaris]NML66159.1 hypothetical protein [Hymenobacter polaris]